MMYKSNFVCSLKVGGKILRENSGVVTLPFGSEYGVLLKNLGSRRAMVKVSVDGQDATEGTRLILQPNSSLELERFIRDGNLKSGNKFKFIERTQKIEDHRGIKEDDGLVRIEFWAEKETVDVPVVRSDVERGNDAGITVPGSESNQSFYSASGFEVEPNSHVIVLQLRGEAGGTPVAAPVAVDLKPTCSICGKKNKSQDRFCGECGTALKLI